jgi:predicted nucleic acid-binding protein
MEVVVQDASTLLNLLKSGLLSSAVESLELRILTTDLVAAEIRSPREGFDQAVSKDWIEIRSFSPLELLELASERQAAKGLSLQDVSVVALARTTGCPLFSSDGPLRTYAHRCELIVHGELWILDQLVAKKFFTPAQAVEKLRLMIEHKARLPQKEVQARIAKWTAFPL